MLSILAFVLAAGAGAGEDTIHLPDQRPPGPESTGLVEEMSQSTIFLTARRAHLDTAAIKCSGATPICAKSLQINQIAWFGTPAGVALVAVSRCAPARPTWMECLAMRSLMRYGWIKI